MNDKISKDMIDLLFGTIVKLQSIEDCKALFTDLCTANEIEQMAQRIRSAELLLEGKTYAQVMAETEISSATLSRVSNCIRHGTGGYKKFLKDIK
jgi:TrpR-related protein YerC/YecD